MGVRVDKWLWAVRGYKTRSQANQGCVAGKVRVNGEIAKPATKVAVGDRVEARLKERTIIYEVVELLEKRVSAELAQAAIVDHSPPPPERPTRGEPVFDPEQFRRDRGAGRPTKRDRRELDKLRRKR